ncbi:SH3 domain-containing protein [Hyalangium rubrum]|uniref:SH3 domain-containing protein n=1 Tax=Hyalangium rubrum TaxID=3103134 RepID=A0ABU5H1R3_9BACT|nr:SH3 domain-containing protein [Hyalangium sp. s54d21]MDY7226722.1 SH3 domain-containing protein [Hyalangium sp. s54d21]
MQTLLISLLLTAVASGAPVEQRVYVQGSSINLRKEPTKDAEALEKLPIGTECLVSEKLPAEWLKVRCGEKEGYASASLLGPQKPSLEKLKAEAKNPKLKLEQRLDSALRAASLAPEDAALQKQLGTLFFERNLQLTAATQKPAMKREFTCYCSKGDALACVKACSARELRNVKVRVEARKNLFVTAIGSGENVAVYRGNYRYNKKSETLTGEVFERTRFATTPVMEKALFAGITPTADDDRLPTLGQYVLDESSQTLLQETPKVWGELIKGAGGLTYMHWSDCSKRPFQVRFVPDMHGRWLFRIESTQSDGGLVRQISSVSKRDNALELTLDDGKVEVFKLPAPESDQASSGETLYSYDIQRYPEQHKPCVEGGP